MAKTKNRPRNGAGEANPKNCFFIEKSVGGASPGRQGLGGWVKLPVRQLSPTDWK